MYVFFCDTPDKGISDGLASQRNDNFVMKLPGVVLKWCYYCQNHEHGIFTTMEPIRVTL